MCLYVCISVFEHVCVSERQFAPLLLGGGGKPPAMKHAETGSERRLLDLAPRRPPSPRLPADVPGPHRPQ